MTEPMKSKLADADRIMALKAGSWIMAMEPVDVTLMTGGQNSAADGRAGSHFIHDRHNRLRLYRTSAVGRFWA